MTAEPPPTPPQEPPDGASSPPPPPPAGAYGQPGPTPIPEGAPAPLAEWWERLVARIIDGVIFGVIAFILSAIFTAMFGVKIGPTGISGSGVLPALLAWLISGAGYVAYDYVLHSKDGQTLGKKIMKIKVVGLGGAALDSATVAKRALVFPGPTALSGIPVINIIASLFMLAVGIFILIDKPLQQGLHDKAAGTVVVKAPQ